MGETFYDLYVYCVYNTRLESVFIAKRIILLDKTPLEISPTGSFPNFPKLYCVYVITPFQVSR